LLKIALLLEQCLELVKWHLLDDTLADGTGEYGIDKIAFALLILRYGLQHLTHSNGRFQTETGSLKKILDTLIIALR
jgi:hypothetical protein